MIASTSASSARAWRTIRSDASSLYSTAEAAANAPASDQADRRREHEPGAAAVDDDVRRRQRVQPEEPGADQEGEPDQQQPRVAPAPAGLADRDRQRPVGHARGQHDPEVRGIDFPAHVERRRGAQDDYQHERERQRGAPQREPGGHVSGRLTQVRMPVGTSGGIRHRDRRPQRRAARDRARRAEHAQRPSFGPGGGRADERGPAFGVQALPDRLKRRPLPPRSASAAAAPRRRGR